MYEFFVTFGHLSINTKVNLKKEEKTKHVCAYALINFADLNGLDLGLCPIIMNIYGSKFFKDMVPNFLSRVISKNEVYFGVLKVNDNDYNLQYGPKILFPIIYKIEVCFIRHKSQ